MFCINIMIYSLVQGFYNMILNLLLLLILIAQCLAQLDVRVTCLESEFRADRCSWLVHEDLSFD